MARYSWFLQKSQAHISSIPYHLLLHCKLLSHRLQLSSLTLKSVHSSSSTFSELMCLLRWYNFRVKLTFMKKKDVCIILSSAYLKLNFIIPDLHSSTFPSYSVFLSSSRSLPVSSVGCQPRDAPRLNIWIKILPKLVNKCI